VRMIRLLGVRKEELSAAKITTTKIRAI